MLFAMDEQGSITDITKAVSGKSYFCPSCHEILITKTKGTKIRPHFAHKASSDCIHGYETALHLMAKKIVEEADSFYLPEISFRRGGGEKDMIVEAQDVNFSHVESEKWLDDIVPDVVGYVAIDGKDIPIAIEILVTHAVDQDKLEKIKAKKLRTIEIDLSKYKENDLPREELAEIILKDSEEKRWLYNPKREKKLESYKSRCAVKTVHSYWKDSELYEVVRNCPRKKFAYEGDYWSHCNDCPYMIYFPPDPPRWTILCELPEHI